MARTRERERRRHRARATEFIALDSHACTACWDCLEACPSEVLGKVDFGRLHRHSRIVAAEACIGCFKCVRACKTGALQRLEAQAPRGSAPVS